MKGLYELMIKRGQDIRSCISDFIIEHGWDDVYIIGAVGSVIDTAYNAPIDDGIPMNLVTHECPGAAEVLSFCGEVMKREKMDPNILGVYKDKSSPLFVHIHASCANGKGEIYGGGLVKGKAFRALRVFMTPLGTDEN